MAGRAFHIHGTVQGVGFRPHAHRLATEEGLTGEVRNTCGGVAITAFGEAAALDHFARRLIEEAPPLARIERVDDTAHEGAAPDRFRIVETRDTGGTVPVTADAALCADCRRELFDPADRRFRYPFINCTNCGPRFTIVESVPYDRATTTMARFAMCEVCAAEYADPGDRRFHAEPIACPRCGPTLTLRTRDGPAKGDPIACATLLLEGGGIVGVMGLGGFHLAVRAEDKDAVERLRERKRRPAKPFALMVRDLAVAERYAVLREAHRAALASVAAPIVLVPTRRRIDGIAPGLREVGLMLPSTPLHALLLKPWDGALVMTSANRTGEPQVTTFEAAMRQLGDVADAWLVHDRPIANRVDDSLVAIHGDAPRLVRRARGYAPAPLVLPDGFAPHPAILALGGDLKNAFALAHDGHVVLSQHMGDLASRTVERDVERSVALLARVSGLEPAHIAVDAHPAYRSRRIGEAYAERSGLPVHRIGHHHAHVAACLAENGHPLDGAPVLALTLDGIGADETGTLLGCELWRANYRSASHLGGLRPTTLLGGDAAAREPWRNLLARLDDAYGADPHAWPPILVRRLADRPWETLLAARRAGMGGPDASSAGRLFDAVAAAIGLCADGQDYEGEAPMRLEALAADDTGRGYAMEVHEEAGRLVLDPAALWLAIDADLGAGLAPADIAARFHRGLADALLAMIGAATPEPGATIALSGGAFHNRHLATMVRQGCAARELRVLEHRSVPAGDGGLALGQAAIAIAGLRAEEDRSCA